MAYKAQWHFFMIYISFCFFSFSWHKSSQPRSQWHTLSGQIRILSVLMRDCEFSQNVVTLWGITFKIFLFQNFSPIWNLTRVMVLFSAWGHQPNGPEHRCASYQSETLSFETESLVLPDAAQNWIVLRKPGKLSLTASLSLILEWHTLLIISFNTQALNSFSVAVITWQAHIKREGVHLAHNSRFQSTTDRKSNVKSSVVVTSHS